MTGVAAPIVVCNEDHRFMVAEDLRKLSMVPSAIILEPTGRNTAPAILIAAFQAVQIDPDAVLLILPADHHIIDTPALLEAFQAGHAATQNGSIVTFGIRPDCSEIGFGYIRKGEELDSGVFKISEFREKPNSEAAQEYVDSGEFFWNSGMFMAKVQTILSEVELYASEVYSACKEAFENAHRDLDFLRLGKSHFESSPAISFDHAVMEFTERGVLIPIDSG